MLLFILSLGVLQGLIAIVISCPFWILGRKRVTWRKIDGLVLFVPYLLWLGLMRVNDLGKSLSNLLEPIIIACLAGLSACVRIVVGSRANETRVTGILLGSVSLLAVMVWRFMPSLPE